MKEPKKKQTKEEKLENGEMKQVEIDFFIDTIDDPIKVAILSDHYGPDRISMLTMGDGLIKRKILALCKLGQKPKQMKEETIYKHAIIDRVYTAYRKTKE
jgi:hypothetical protein